MALHRTWALRCPVLQNSFCRCVHSCYTPKASQHTLSAGTAISAPQMSQRFDQHPEWICHRLAPCQLLGAPCATLRYAGQRGHCTTAQLVLVRLDTASAASQPCTQRYGKARACAVMTGCSQTCTTRALLACLHKGFTL
jgi:hypothetical protein